MDILIAISIGVTAIATGFIAWYAHRTHELATRNAEQVSDLYQAIVVATLVGHAGMTNQGGRLIEQFQAHYRGSTPIFE